MKSMVNNWCDECGKKIQEPKEAFYCCVGIHAGAEVQQTLIMIQRWEPAVEAWVNNPVLCSRECVGKYASAYFAPLVCASSF